MKAMDLGDHRYEAGDADFISGRVDDPFESGRMPQLRNSRLNLCMQCHVAAGVRSVITVNPLHVLRKGANPEAIIKVHIDPSTGLGDWQCRQLAFKLGLTGAAFKDACKLFKGLYKTYLAADCSMLEINPVIITSDGEVIALDAKVDIDDNAAFRQKAIVAMHDSGEMEASEVEAAAYGLNFIKLDGNIGCMVNGAGLAMATMDIIKLYGGEPANFLDVGGGAKVEQVKAAFKIISADPNVQAIMVNIFGGIMKCDVIAEGVIAAVKEVGLDLPLVVRLAGTNVDLGKKMLDESGLAITSATNLADAAEKAVAAVKA